MNKALQFSAELKPRGSAAAIVLTDDQVTTLAAGRKTFPVKVTVNGAHTLDLRVARMGGENLIGFSKAARETAQVAPGDTVQVEIVMDGSERAIEVPDDLAQALADAGIVDEFAKLAPSHRKEYVRWITEAKRPETRSKRLAEAVLKITEGKPRT